jgi:hypothetical protein
VGFDEVTSDGQTDVEVLPGNPGPVISGYTVLSDNFDITKTAGYSGNVEICMDYDDTDMTVAEELSIRFWHLEGGVWIDRTTSIDTTDNTVCATVSNLSEFVVAIFQPWVVDNTSAILADTSDAIGVSWVDYDSDGDPDLYVTNHLQPDRLFRNDGGGAFVDVTAAPLGHAGQGSHGCWGDYDGDGDPDLYLTVRSAPNVLYRNDGGSFTDVSAAPLNDAGESRGAAWADYDNDGDLDLYLANYGQANKLFRNEGDGSFVDATTAPLNDAGQGTGVAWADYDDDGDLDLYLANTDTTPNRLFENLGGGSFTDSTPTPLADTGQGRGVAWGDYDNDGDLDLYLANGGSGANKLFRNDGGGAFTDVTGGPLGDTNDSRGVAWGDYDNDGNLDLYVANLNAPNRLIRNLGGGSFSDVTGVPLDDAGYGIGVAWADYDGDGDLDLYLANAFGANRLFRNDQLVSNHWLHVRLVGTVSNEAGVGARVRVVSGGVGQIREISCGSGYLSQNSLLAEFGLGTSATVDLLEITWPSGIVNSYTDGIAIDRVLVIGESEGGATGVEPPSALPIQTRLHAPIPNPFNPMTTIGFDLAKGTRVYLRLYDVAGRHVRTLVDGIYFARGSYQEDWDGTDAHGRRVASGVYHVRLETADRTETKRVALVR